MIADPADRAAVWSTAYGFELVDDLHGSNLGRARDRAAGKGRSEEPAETYVCPQRAGDLSDALMDGRVCFDHSGLRYAH